MLIEAFGLQGARVISLCGAGGKTTLMFSLAREFVAAGERVLITTTTKIARDEAGAWPSLAAASAAEVIDGAQGLLPETGTGRQGAVIAYSRARDNVHRLTGFTPQLVDELAAAGHFDRVLVEADGSARKPLKAPAAHEPVIPSATDALIVVAGLQGLGLPLREENLFRAGIWSRLSGLAPGAPVSAESLARCVAHADGLTRGCPAGARRVLFLNQADTPARREQAERVAECLSASPGNTVDAVVIGRLLPGPWIAEPLVRYPGPRENIIPGKFMRVALLGGSGLIGGTTAARLAAQGAQVIVLSRNEPPRLAPGCQWRGADVTDAAGLEHALAAVQPGVVVHLAAFLQYACEQDPTQAVRVNVDGTVNVLEACRRLGVRRMVFASSIAAYGERSDLMREDDPPGARTGLYGMTKRMGEMLGERYAALHGLEFIALRYAGVFGPGEVHSPGMALVRQQIKQCALGHDVVVDGATGDERSHLTHAEDAAEATCRAALHPKPAHRVYNVGGPPQNWITLREFHAAVRVLAPGAGSALWRGRGRDSGPVDLARLREDLGFTPAVTVAAGLRADLGLTARSG